MRGQSNQMKNLREGQALEARKRAKEGREGKGREKAPIEGKASIKIDQKTPPQKPKEDKGLRMIDWKIIGN